MKILIWLKQQLGHAQLAQTPIRKMRNNARFAEHRDPVLISYDDNANNCYELITLTFYIL